MYLLDTNIVFELRKPRPHGVVIAWNTAVPDAELFFCAVTLAEIQVGIEITRRQDPEKANLIEAWLDQLAAAYNVLPMRAEPSRTGGGARHRRLPGLEPDAGG